MFDRSTTPSSSVRPYWRWDRERLEKVCRYAGRPEVAESRLVELGGGRIGYSLKKRWPAGRPAPWSRT